MSSPLPSVAQGQDFDYWMGLPGEWVEQPNERRGGTSGVQRVQLDDGRLLYRKQQVDHCYRDWQHPLGEPTVRREERVIQAFNQLGIPVPELVFCGTRRREDGRWQALLLTEALNGFVSLDECFSAGLAADWSAALRHALFVRVGEVLSRMHRARWQHGCLYPKHIFVRIDADDRFEVALLDLEKCRQRFSRLRAARSDMRQLKRRCVWGDAEWRSLAEGYEGTGGAPLSHLLAD